MDPITIGLAIAGAKKLLETATDIKDIAGSIEQLFSHTEKAERNKGVAKQDGGDTSIASVVTDVLTEKNNATKLRNLEIDIDNKFGAGTWEAIKTERQIRLDAVEVDKVKAAKKKRAKDRASQEFFDKCIKWILGFIQLLAIIGVTSLAGYLIWINRCIEGTC